MGNNNRQVATRQPSAPARQRAQTPAVRRPQAPTVVDAEFREITPHGRSEYGQLGLFIAMIYVVGIGVAIILLTILYPVIEFYVNSPH
jgi:hypothetical protein